jgi:hypothetical protein
VPGSKLRWYDFVGGAFDLAWIFLQYRRGLLHPMPTDLATTAHSSKTNGQVGNRPHMIGEEIPAYSVNDIGRVSDDRFQSAQVEEPQSKGFLGGRLKK